MAEDGPGSSHLSKQTADKVEGMAIAQVVGPIHIKQIFGTPLPKLGEKDKDPAEQKHIPLILNSSLGTEYFRGIIDEITKRAHRYKQPPAEICAAGHHMELLGNVLDELTILTESNKRAAKSVKPAKMRELTMTLKEIDGIAKDVLFIFNEWKEHDDQARFRWVTGKYPKQLVILDCRTDSLTAYFRLWIRHLKRVAGNLAIAPGTATTTEIESPKMAPGLVIRPCSEKSILFVDSFDVGKGVIAKLHLSLLQAQAAALGLRMPLKLIHSGGFRVAANSALEAAQQKLQKRFQWKTIAKPGSPTNRVALDSVFGNQFYREETKAKVRSPAYAYRSRGVPLDYWHYDYIVVFGENDKTSVESLFDALEAMGCSKPMMGRLVRLAQYHPRVDIRYIATPTSNDDRDQWNKTYSLIKLALAQFLKQELGWISAGRDGTAA